ncbi:MAG TPA: septum formation initiator family protein [Intrasporangium sp.]|uniref:FtsB family cell division protein n=1 Tax=Intrasporangium sp. TaxID=1925024 RepID=UPI002D766A6E|nr:septum formation initiator family protein [Intrasporangium sp.]HET7400066.1 septum formation initiator family protein [Intrasporangium sp.]
MGILVVLAVMLMPTVRSLVAQRGDAAALAGKVEQQRATVQQLQRQAALWKDPAYIEVQARERLKFVRVGDRAYSVIDAGAGPTTPKPAERPVVAAPLANASSPWYGKLWQSVQIADRPAAGLPKSR